MFTVFLLPKPFVGHIGMIQRNAIKSLTLMRPQPEIIIFGNEQGVGEAAREFNTLHVPDVKRNELGTPLINDFFKKGCQMAKFDTLCYLNADIILMSDFIEAVKQVQSHQRRFMLAGQRWDLDVTEPLDFRDGWENRLSEQAKTQGSLHNIMGMDYFIFSKDIIAEVPPMAVGRANWDNWFLFYARARGAVLVDITASVVAIHQNHNYAHHPDGKDGAYKGIEAQRNLELAGGMDHYFTLRDATHQLLPNGQLRRFTDRWHVRRWFLTLPILRPKLGLPVRAVLKLIEWTYPLRAKLGMKLPDHEQQEILLPK